MWRDVRMVKLPLFGREEWEKRTDGDSHAIPSPELPRTVEEGLSLRERIAVGR
jgi:hypothetical protein